MTNEHEIEDASLEQGERGCPKKNWKHWMSCGEDRCWRWMGAIAVVSLAVLAVASVVCAVQLMNISCMIRRFVYICCGLHRSAYWM